MAETLSRRLWLLIGGVAIVSAVAPGGCEDRGAAPVPAPVDQPVVLPVATERPTGPLPAGVGCLDAGCHEAVSTGRFVHGVLRSRDACFSCHERDEGGHVFPLKRPGNQGCTHCHAEVVGQKVAGHGASEVSCLACHDPHVSAHGALMKGPVADVCSACHRMDMPAIAHPPFADGACVACHEPHESDVRPLLRGGAGAEHCYLCHEETRRAMTAAKRIHAPAKQDCKTCHAAHGSEHPHLLADDVDRTCFTCHTDLEATVAGAPLPHGAVTTLERCANCHDAHASDRPSLLKDRQDVLCLRCHDKPIKADDGRTIPDMTPAIHERAFLHGPVKSGNCTACHNVHGASHARLLRENFAPTFYSTFDLKNYALCFDCHESAIVTEPRTTTLTDFRNGDVNLHFLHVNREKKGRTCRACHEMHGSNLPAHVAESVPFEGSGWALPIGFEPTETGGRCGPGCHAPMTYDREAAPIIEPATPPDAGGTP